MDDVMAMKVSESFCNLNYKMFGVFLINFTDLKTDITGWTVLKNKCEVSLLFVVEELATIDDVGVFQGQIWLSFCGGIVDVVFVDFN